MSEDYIRGLEGENDRLRVRIVIAEEESERVWGILDAVKAKILSAPCLAPKASLEERNVDRSGKIIMIDKKKLKSFLEDLEDIENYFEEIVDIINGEGHE